MDIEEVAPRTVHKLAALSNNTTTLYFGVGASEADELLRYVAARLSANEALVIIAEGAGCLSEIEAPEHTPAIGAQSSVGCIIDYGYDLQSLDELLIEARRWHRG